MNPDLTGWCCAEHLREKARAVGDRYTRSSNPVSLDTLLAVLGIDRPQPSHNAGPDSLATWLALAKLHHAVRGGVDQCYLKAA